MFLNRLRIEDTDTPDQWVVIAPLVWVDPTYGRVVVPAGTVTDLASIPRFLRDREAFDPNGASRRPAVVHDFLYASACFDKPRADRFLRDALLVEGVKRPIAVTYYYAVRWFGGAAWNGHRARQAI
jgi:hypothetical protein